MRGKGKWRVWMGLVWCGAAACGQELVLPDQGPTNDAPDAPSEGFTGAGGGEDEVASKPRLPVADQPIFTTFGGAGGEAGSPSDGAGATSPHGGTSPQKVGEGGRPSSAGANGTSGGKTGVGGSVATAGDANAGAGGAINGPPALLFSEYVEGTGSFKALEIYALEASSLEGCDLQTYSNGKAEPSRLALHGKLAQGELLVLCSTALGEAQPKLCRRSTNLSFNGDDALALSCGGELLDVIGQIGVDPGDSWGMGATLDHTLRRRCEVTTGRRDGSTPFEIDTEWLTLGADTIADLGGRDCAP